MKEAKDEVVINKIVVSPSVSRKSSPNMKETSQAPLSLYFTEDHQMLETMPGLSADPESAKPLRKGFGRTPKKKEEVDKQTREAIMDREKKILAISDHYGLDTNKLDPIELAKIVHEIEDKDLSRDSLYFQIARKIKSEVPSTKYYEEYLKHKGNLTKKKYRREKTPEKHRASLDKKIARNNR